MVMVASLEKKELSAGSVSVLFSAPYCSSILIAVTTANPPLLPHVTPYTLEVVAPVHAEARFVQGSEERVVKAAQCLAIAWRPCTSLVFMANATGARVGCAATKLY